MRHEPLDVHSHAVDESGSIALEPRDVVIALGICVVLWLLMLTAAYQLVKLIARWL